MAKNTKTRYCHGCIRRMDVEKAGHGDFAYYKGTLDCPGQISVDVHHKDEVLLIEACGCCSFDDGSTVKTPEECRYRVVNGACFDCDCHNTPIIYGSCMSKRVHGVCPYGLGE